MRGWAVVLLLLVGCGDDDELSCADAWEQAAEDGTGGNPDDLQLVVEACGTTREFLENAQRDAVKDSPLDDAMVLCDRGEISEGFCDDAERVLGG